MRIGIDVGGTNTDAVLMDGQTVVSWTKTPTTPNVTEGITTALRAIVIDSGLNVKELDGVMIGTTHFTNAVVERRRLAADSLYPAGTARDGVCLPPMVDWPDELRDVVGRSAITWPMVGTSSTGAKSRPLTLMRSSGIADTNRGKGHHGHCDLVGLFAGQYHLRGTGRRNRPGVIPDAHITLSSTIGRIGLLERENAAIMNACLRDLALSGPSTASRLRWPNMKIDAPFYLSQNDGTLMNADFAAELSRC